MLREVVVDDQHVAASFHVVLGDAGRGIGRDVEETGGIVPFGDDNHGVLHGAFVAQGCNDLGDSGCTLANGAIDTHDVLVALVQDGVDRDCRLSRSAIAQNQLALTSADGNERIDDLQTGLKWHGHRRAVHDRGRRAFDG